MFKARPERFLSHTRSRTLVAVGELYAIDLSLRRDTRDVSIAGVFALRGDENSSAVLSGRRAAARWLSGEGAGCAYRRLRWGDGPGLCSPAPGVARSRRDEYSRLLMAGLPAPLLASISRGASGIGVSSCAISCVAERDNRDKTNGRRCGH